MSGTMALANKDIIDFKNDKVSRSAFIEHAKAMVPHLLAQQEETEKRSFYSEETHEMFRNAGFYRMLVPKQFGGYGLDGDTFFRVAAIIASGCPSTAWQYCFGHSHAVAAGALFDQKVQAELFRDADFICAGTVKPQAKAQRQPNGTWLLNGTVNYCSGIPYSTHFMSHALIVDESGKTTGTGTFVAPPSTWTRLDDWGHSLGLKGSGSHSIVFENAVVPAEFVLPGVDFADHTAREDSVGRRQRRACGICVVAENEDDNASADPAEDGGCRLSSLFRRGHVQDRPGGSGAVRLLPAMDRGSAGAAGRNVGIHGLPGYHAPPHMPGGHEHLLAGHGDVDPADRGLVRSLRRTKATAILPRHGHVPGARSSGVARSDAPKPR